jgi:hypothetical protein
MQLSDRLLDVTVSDVSGLLSQHRKGKKSIPFEEQAEEHYFGSVLGDHRSLAGSLLQAQQKLKSSYRSQYRPSAENLKQMCVELKLEGRPKH